MDGDNAAVVSKTFKKQADNSELYLLQSERPLILQAIAYRSCLKLTSPRP